jgi:enamine deaminase RidA (YjgF/YER057c/UK114 family)
MPEKRTFRSGFPAEDGYGYAQAVETGGTIYISGQVAFDPSGAIDRTPGAEAQMRRAYANARAVLAHFGVGPEAVVDELVFVKGGLAEAMEFVGRVRKEFYGERPEVASTIVETPRLAAAEFLVEIKLVAKL